MKDIFNFFEKPKDPRSFSAIRIMLASPENNPRDLRWKECRTTTIFRVAIEETHILCPAGERTRP